MLPGMGRMGARALMLENPAGAGYAAVMSSDARSTARRYYEGSGRSLESDMGDLGANPQGVVIFLPRLVVLMKPVESTRPERWMELGTTPHGADAWYVHLLVGDLTWARRIGRSLPVYPWLCFQRGARSSTLHRVEWERFVSGKL